MITAFQFDAFQTNAFQILAGVIADSILQQQGAGGLIIRDGEQVRKRKLREKAKLQEALQGALDALSPAQAEPEIKEIIKAVKAEAGRLDAIEPALLVAYDFAPLYAAIEQLQQLVDERLTFLRDEEEAITAILLTMH